MIFNNFRNRLNRVSESTDFQNHFDSKPKLEIQIPETSSEEEQEGRLYSYTEYEANKI